MIKPCVQSGFCCTQAPCSYGLALDSGECASLMEPNENGQRLCAQYDHIVASEKGKRWPMMGGGCSSTLFNSMRDAVIVSLGDNNG